MNNGICIDKNPGFECNCTDDFVGSFCEYVKGSCDFDDSKSPICGYQDEIKTRKSKISSSSIASTSLSVTGEFESRSRYTKDSNLWIPW